MSKEMKLIPELRFPEFLNKGQWTKTRLADFNDVESGDGDWILSKDISPNGEYRIVQLSSIGFGGFKEKTLKTITIDKFGELNGTPIQKGDLLINRMVDSDKINSCIFPFDGKYVTSVDVCWIRQNRAFNNYFMMSLICTGSNQRNLLSLSSGAGRVRISKTNLFEKFVFPFPKVPEEQQKIASCLSSLDELIAAHKDKLDALKDHKKGLLQNLFPQEGETVPKVRFPEFEGDGEWEMKPLEEVSKITTGNKDTQDKIDDGKYPFFVRSQTIERINSYSYDGEAILTSGDGVGVGKIYHYIIGKFDFHQRVYCIYDFDKNVEGKFIFYFFSEHFYQRVMQLSAKNSVDSVRRAMITEMPIAVPPTKKEQQKIASCLSAVDELITAQQEKIEQLQQHKKGLMQGLFPNSTKLMRNN